MNETRSATKLPSERLKRLKPYSDLLRRQLWGPNYLTAITLVLLLALLVGVGLIVGRLSADIFGEYAQRVLDWARGSHH